MSYTQMLNNNYFKYFNWVFSVVIWEIASPPDETKPLHGLKLIFTTRCKGREKKIKLNCNKMNKCVFLCVNQYKKRQECVLSHPHTHSQSPPPSPPRSLTPCVVSAVIESDSRNFVQFVLNLPLMTSSGGWRKERWNQGALVLISCCEEGVWVCVCFLFPLSSPSLLH